jgi:hypothetical protein
MNLIGCTDVKNVKFADKMKVELFHLFLILSIEFCLSKPSLGEMVVDVNSDKLPWMKSVYPLGSREVDCG